MGMLVNPSRFAVVGGGGGPAIGNYNSNTGSGSATLSLTKPTISTNDLGIIIMAGRGDGTFTTPSGWTLIREYDNSVNFQHINVAAYYRVITGSESASETITYSISEELIGWYVQVTGAATSSPLDVTGAGANNNGTSLAIPEVTASVADTLVIYAHAFDSGDSTAFTISGTGWSKEEELELGANVWNMASSWGTKDMATAAATTDATVGSSTTEGHVGFQFNINT